MKILMQFLYVDIYAKDCVWIVLSWEDYVRVTESIEKKCDEYFHFIKMLKNTKSSSHKSTVTFWPMRLSYLL